MDMLEHGHVRVRACYELTVLSSLYVGSHLSLPETATNVSGSP